MKAEKSSRKSQRQAGSGWYKRVFAWLMAHGGAEYEGIGDRKRSLFTNIHGNVLEIGPGAGSNLSYYPQDIHSRELKVIHLP